MAAQLRDCHGTDARFDDSIHVALPITNRLTRIPGEAITYVLAHTDATSYTPADEYPERTGLLRLLYLDEAIAVVDKPAFLPTENTRHIKDSARQRLEELLASRGENVDQLRLPHRLDWETSGLLVFARGADAMRSLAMQFAERSVQKMYIADVISRPPATRGTVELPLTSDRQRLPMQCIDFGPAGKPARTSWEVVRGGDDAMREGAGGAGGACRLCLKPETGRRHQLRMHCLALGCPIAFDALYLRPEEIPGDGVVPPRLHLHAAELIFRHPTSRELLRFVSEPPFTLDEVRPKTKFVAAAVAGASRRRREGCSAMSIMMMRGRAPSERAALLLAAVGVVMLLARHRRTCSASGRNWCMVVNYLKRGPNAY